MALVVTLAGVVIAALGLAGVASPARATAAFTRWRAPERLWTAVGVRLVLGVAFLVVAPACRLPLVVQVVGLLALVGAGGIALMGARRFASFVAWWLEQPPARMRLWYGGSLAFGALLVYAA